MASLRHRLVVSGTVASCALVSAGSMASAFTPPSTAATLAATLTSLASTTALTQTIPRAQSKMLVGGRVKTATSNSDSELLAAFKSTSATMGGWDVSRSFHGTLPSVESPITPWGVVEITSYKSTQTNLASYVTSMRGRNLIAWWHEPEGPTDNWDPAVYRAKFVNEYQTAHAAKSDVKFGQISGGYQWRTGKRGANGDYLPPMGSVDWLGFDTYRTGTDDTFNAIVPIQKMVEFQNWYAKARTYGVPLYITEYGRGVVGTVGADSKRAAVIPQDYAYLKGLNFSGMSFWYSDSGPDGRPWAFTDSASIQATRTISQAE